jgi:hypothetical protein
MSEFNSDTPDDWEDELRKFLEAAGDSEAGGFIGDTHYTDDGVEINEWTGQQAYPGRTDGTYGDEVYHGADNDNYEESDDDDPDPYSDQASEIDQVYEVAERYIELPGLEGLLADVDARTAPVSRRIKADFDAQEIYVPPERTLYLPRPDFATSPKDYHRYVRRHGKVANLHEGLQTGVEKSSLTKHTQYIYVPEWDGLNLYGMSTTVTHKQPHWTDIGRLRFLFNGTPDEPHMIGLSAERIVKYVKYGLSTSGRFGESIRIGQRPSLLLVKDGRNLVYRYSARSEHFINHPPTDRRRINRTGFNFYLKEILGRYGDGHPFSRQ